MAELTPTSSPFMLTSAPPELPGLIAASVWIASSTVFWFCASPPAATGRLSALTMPVVTVPSRPSGEPIGDDVLADPQIAGRTERDGRQPGGPVGLHDRDVTAGIGADHRERRGVAVGEGDLGLHAAWPPVPLAAATTWLLVRMSPSVERMMPEPSSDCLPMSVSSLTTLGTTLAATCSTEPAGRLAAGWLGAAPETVGTRGPWAGCTSGATPPPTPADTNAMARAPAVKSPARERFCGRSRNRRAASSGWGRRSDRDRAADGTADAAAGWRSASRRTAAARRGAGSPSVPRRRRHRDGPVAAVRGGSGGEYLGWFVIAARCSSLQ